MPENGDILLYQTEDGEVSIEVHLGDDTVWLSQAQMAELFQTERSVITKHVNNVFRDGELPIESNVQKLHITPADKPTQFYSLDVIISVGFRVNARRGVQLRIWANKNLKEYMIKGFVMDDERLAGRGNNYFDDLLERVRKIRASEAHFYQKVRSIFATSIDYDPKAETATVFFQTVQNKFHYAITGQTAAEIIVNRVSAQKRDMGLTHKKGKRVTKQEITVAKNYLEELELKRLELLVEQFLSFAELQSVEQRPMYMSDWTRKLDEFIKLNDKKVLIGKGSVTSEFAKQVAADEYEIYARRLLEGDTDDDYTKDDFERAIDMSARQIAAKSVNGGKQ